MKNKIIWIVAALVLVVLIAVASVLYSSLSEENKGGGLIIDMPTTDTTTDADDLVGTAPPETGENASDTPATLPPEESSASTDAVTDEATTEKLEEPENPAPDFTMVDMNGKEVKLSELRGKPVVLNFWASWCGYCVYEMPAFEEYYKIYGDEIHFVMLNTLSGGETVASAKKFISNNGYTFPIYFDESGLASHLYGAYLGIPLTFFIDAKGNLVSHVPGSLNAEILKQGIAMIQ